MISHEDLRNQLEEFGAVVSASELHGHLCGRLVVGQQISGARGQKILSECLGFSAEELGPSAEELGPSADSLVELADEITLLLENDLFDFRLLLPPDNEAIYIRVEALADWCQGFLNGVGTSAGLAESGVMKEENETISDLVEITQISIDVEESEENEAFFLEISEYVRLAVFNLFDQFRIQDGESVSTGVNTPIH